MTVSHNLFKCPTLPHPPRAAAPKKLRIAHCITGVADHRTPDRAALVDEPGYGRFAKWLAQLEQQAGSNDVYLVLDTRATIERRVRNDVRHPEGGLDLIALFFTACHLGLHLAVSAL